MQHSPERCSQTGWQSGAVARRFARRLQYHLKRRVAYVEYCYVLATDVAHSAAQGVNPRDVIVAIVGGTMLTLALTRPRLRGVEQLTEDSERGRRWADRG